MLATVGLLSVVAAARNPVNDKLRRHRAHNSHAQRLRSQAIELDLPEKWKKYMDPNTHSDYYYNQEDKVGTWQVPPPDLVASLPECKADMIRTSYTHCVSKSSSRALTYFYGQLCKGGTPLPPAVTDIPCNITCSPGQYLPLGTAMCRSCEPGTYSVGGGVRILSWEKFPEDMSTKCDFQLEADQSEGCTGWILNGTVVHSGDQRGKRLVDSTLRYEVELVRSGFVSFEYKVDAERRWDGLYFTVDGEVAMEMTSYEFQFTEMRFPLPAGFHTLEWVYHKDVAYEMGQDRAWIQSIQIDGTLDNTAMCSKCPWGHYSETGATKCLKCAVNTYSNVAGSAHCNPCNPEGAQDSAFKFALPGAKSCKAAPKCTANDMVRSYSECKNSERTQSEAYNQPQICHGGVHPAPEKQVKCALCDPGMYRKGKDCEWCPAGKFNPISTHKGVSACKTCPKGSVAKKVKWYDNAFAQRDFQKYLNEKRIATGCANGFCAQGGWRALGQRMDSGIGNGQVADIWLSLGMNLETWGAISFNFSMHASNMESRLEFYVDEERMWDIESMQAMNPNDALLTFKTPVPPGAHLATWVLHKERGYSWMEDGVEIDTHDEDIATIQSILVEGVEVPRPFRPARSLSDLPGASLTRSFRCQGWRRYQVLPLPSRVHCCSWRFYVPSVPTRAV